MNHWIDTPERLKAHLAAWSEHNIVALDTEFVREKTYYPQLALVQLGVPGEILLIDPLIPGMAEELKPLLLDPRIRKIIHSPSEDLQAFARGVGAIPENIFDTQAAAALCGMGNGLGYQKLVELITGNALEKGETRSDWLKRPLTESQCHYAADDVHYLGLVVAQRTGLQPPEAEKRVADIYAQTQAWVTTTESAVRESADKARKASAYGLLWLFVALLIGAFVASLAATFGGSQRDA